MIKKISLKNAVIIFSAVILLAFVRSSYADAGSFTINVPNSQGGYTAIVIQQSGGGFIGPQGEYYTQFPSVAQLRVMYGVNAPQAAVVVAIAPPALPVYEQPDPPAVNYIWTPGYWAYDSFFEDYYWVPGTWVTPPYHGYLWTPGYWAWRHGNFIFCDGYWGPHIGFYGGINYGFGYEGHGFSGGSWKNGIFISVRFGHGGGGNAANNISSFNGGPGGVKAQPTPEERSAMKEKHIPATAEQKKHVQAAHKNPALRASMNHGKPAIAATARPGVFKGKGVVAAKKAGVFYNKTAAHHNKAKPKAKPRPKAEIKKPKASPDQPGQ